MTFIKGHLIDLDDIDVRDTLASENYPNWMNDPETIRYLESRFYHNTPKSLREYVVEQNANPHVFFLAIRNKSRIHIGNIKLSNVSVVHRTAEVSLVISSRYWGQGIGTEAISLISDFAFSVLDLHKLYAGAYSENIASIRAFQRAGFEVEGEIKNMYHTEDGRTGRVLLGRSRQCNTAPSA